MRFYGAPPMADAEIPEGYSHEDGVYWERDYGKTPSGGDYSEILYFDKDGNLVPPEPSHTCKIRECMSDGTLVGEVSGLI